MRDSLAVMGSGLVSPAGVGLAALCDAVATDRSCLGPLGEEIARGLPVTIGARMQMQGAPCTRASQAAFTAFREASGNAGSVNDDPERRGLVIGTSLGTMERTEAWLAGTEEPHDLSWLHPDALTRDLAQWAGISGPTGTYSVTCVSALYALEQASADLHSDRADVVWCGGIETLSRTVQAGFCALDALSTTATADGPPVSDGIVLGEGVCFVVLRRLATAGAGVRAVIEGRGLSADATHLTSPDESGAGMKRAIQAALDDAGRTPADLAWVTLTAPASPAYAKVYEAALSEVLGDDWRARTLTWERSLGHMLAASGTLGIAFATLLIEGRLSSIAPPTRDGAECVLALSVGFGGLNGATLVGPPPGGA